VDVLVVHHAPQILNETGLERGDILQTLVVDPLRRQVRVDVAERFDLDVLEPGEATLQRVALAADPDARRHHTIVGPQHPTTNVRRRLQAPRQKAAAGPQARRRPDADPEFTPRNAVWVVSFVSHTMLLVVTEREDRQD